MGLPEVPSVEEVRGALRMPRSKFKEHAEYMLAESQMLERALKSDVYRQLWKENRYPATLDGLLQMPVLTSAFYSGYEERDPRIPAGPVKADKEGWLCSTGSIRMKFFSFSEYDERRLGTYGSRGHMMAGLPQGGAIINCGAEPPHCSLTMSQWMAKSYGMKSIPVIRGMKPEKVMEELMANADNIVGIIGVPLITLRFLNTIVEKTGKPLEKMFPKFRKAILGGENLNTKQRDALRKLGIEGHNIYASAELCVPAAECDVHDGLHLFGDDVIPRLEAENGTAKYIWDCEKGHIGELIVTTPNREAFPLVNYRTNDVLEVIDTECPCGVTTPRIRVISRTDNVMNIGGAKAYECHIEERFEEVGRTHTIPDWQINWRMDNNNGIGYHRFEVLIDNDALNPREVKDALLESLAGDKRTEQLFQAQEAGILNIDIRPLSHGEFEEKTVKLPHKRVRIVKKF